MFPTNGFKSGVVVQIYKSTDRGTLTEIKAICAQCKRKVFQCVYNEGAK